MKRSLTWQKLAKVQGQFYLATGLWPLLHRKSFEVVTGLKKDWWLVQTLGVLMTVIGTSLIAATQKSHAEPDTIMLAAGSAVRPNKRTADDRGSLSLFNIGSRGLNDYGPTSRLRVMKTILLLRLPLPHCDCCFDCCLCSADCETMREMPGLLYDQLRVLLQSQIHARFRFDEQHGRLWRRFHAVALHPFLRILFGSNLDLFFDLFDCSA